MVSCRKCDLCDQTNLKTPGGLSLFTLPKSPKDVREDWINILRKNCPEKKISQTTTLICYLHFESNWISKESDGYRKRLIYGAVPSLYLSKDDENLKQKLKELAENIKEKATNKPPVKLKKPYVDKPNNATSTDNNLTNKNGPVPSEVANTDKEPPNEDGPTSSAMQFGISNEIEPPTKKFKPESIKEKNAKKLIITLDQMKYFSFLKTENDILRQNVLKLRKSLAKSNLKLDKQKKKLVKVKSEKKKKQKPTQIIKNPFEIGSKAGYLFENEVVNMNRQENYRRYNQVIREMCLALNSYSSKSYSYMRSFLTLPHPQTLVKWMAQVETIPGFLFRVIKEVGRLSKVDDQFKICNLLVKKAYIEENQTPETIFQKTELLQSLSLSQSVGEPENSKTLESNHSNDKSSKSIDDSEESSDQTSQSHKENSSLNDQSSDRDNVIEPEKSKTSYSQNESDNPGKIPLNNIKKELREVEEDTDQTVKSVDNPKDNDDEKEPISFIMIGLNSTWEIPIGYFILDKNQEKTKSELLKMAKHHLRSVKIDIDKVIYSD